MGTSPMTLTVSEMECLEIPLLRDWAVFIPFHTY